MRMVQTILAGMAVFLLTAAAEAAMTDRIVAIVNDQLITLSELNEAFEPFRARVEQNYKGEASEKAISESRTMLLNRLIDNLLIEQEARKAGVEVRDEEVTTAIQDILTRRKLTQGEMLKTLQREGMTMADYRKEVRNQMIRIRLVRRALQAKVAVTDEEVGAYYLKHQADYEGKEAVRIRQIVLLLPRGVGDSAKEKLRAEAADIHRRLLAGEPFEKLAVQHSQGPAAATGGDVGYVERGVMHTEVEEAAFSLPVNKISDVIASSVGFHIVEVLDRRGGGLKNIASVRDEIRERIEQEKMEKKFEEWLEELRKKSHIEIKL